MERPVLIMVTTGGRGTPSVETPSSPALLLVKTVESRSQAVQEYVRANHAYELPEIIQIGIDGGLPPYLEWLADQVAESPR